MSCSGAQKHGVERHFERLGLTSVQDEKNEGRRRIRQRVRVNILNPRAEEDCNGMWHFEARLMRRRYLKCGPIFN